MELALDLPSQFAAGTTVKYRPSLADLGYSASDGWGLTVFLAGPAFPDLAELANGADGTADGDAFIVVLAAADTAVLKPGLYSWIERVSRGGEVYDPRSGDLTVTQNVATATAGQLESHDEVMLALVRTRITARISKDMARLSAFDRAIEREELEKLHNLEQYYLERIATRRRGTARRAPERLAFTRPD